MELHVFTVFNKKVPKAICYKIGSEKKVLISDDVKFLLKEIQKLKKASNIYCNSHYNISTLAILGIKHGIDVMFLFKKSFDFMDFSKWMLREAIEDNDGNIELHELAKFFDYKDYKELLSDKSLNSLEGDALKSKLIKNLDALIFCEKKLRGLCKESINKRKKLFPIA